ncbi:MAG TPA: FAD-dependent oxidoreductase [Candidatus Saccharimonadales bacterium]|nr:FAD-dependent oxidoreductase [Candidatus Saccharimonadales bacterium]
MEKNKKKILIIGGGFGGIKVALELADNDRFDVALLSEQDNFRYYPTLYHAATGGRLSASQIPLSEIFAGKNVKLIKDSAKNIDRTAKHVVGESGKKYSYDDLVIALGVITNYFGIKGLKEYSYGIKTIEDATELRDHLHKQMLDEGKPDLNYVVIGGGPTGVELAGALPAYLKSIMARHGIKKHSLHIDLVEAAPQLMGRMPKSYSKAVARRLRRLGVKLYLGQTVSAETAEGLTVSGHDIASHTVVWTAGVTNHPFFSANEFKLNERGKVLVDDHLQAEDNIYVIGDNADTLYSGMAQTALYDASFVTRNLKRLARGKAAKAYTPKRPIYVTPVGPWWAAVLWGKVQIYGKLGWLLRSAADFRGFNDYEPWWKSSKHWLAENMEGPEDCTICAPKKIA